MRKKMCLLYFWILLHWLRVRIFIIHDLRRISTSRDHAPQEVDSFPWAEGIKNRVFCHIWVWLKIGGPPKPCRNGMILVGNSWIFCTIILSPEFEVLYRVPWMHHRNWWTWGFCAPEVGIFIFCKWETDQMRGQAGLCSCHFALQVSEGKLMLIDQLLKSVKI